MKIALAAAALLALTACASAPRPADQAFDPAATRFVGYLRFEEGEFQLYEREAQVRAPFARPCVSGALPLNAQRSARSDLSGQKVTLTGRAMAWPANAPAGGIDYEGSQIRNTCGGAHVIQAVDVSVIR